MSTLRTIYQKLLPSAVKATIWKIRQNIDLTVEYLRDISRYHKHSGFHPSSHDAEALLSEIMIDYHRLEKGLSLENPRPGFGREVATRLFRDMHRYLDQCPPNHVIIDALASIQSYIAFQRQHDSLRSEVAQAYETLINRIEPTPQTLPEPATACVTRDEIQAAIQLDYQRFLHARHSVRAFTQEPVSQALLTQAIAWAGTAPTVCNRQAARAHIISDRDRVSRIADIQKGGVSFKNGIATMIVVSVDLKRFVSIGERNQPWVDGGIFLMNLLLGLHAVGLGACCLNWCSGRSTDRALRHELQLPDHESIIALIAVGHLKQEFQVAKATKLPVELVAKFY